MTWKRIAGIVLVLLGIIGIIFKGITWSSRKPIIQVGTLHMDVTVHHHLWVEPVVAGLAIVLGLILLVLSFRSPRP
ncbi:MAG: hypothetical protein HKL95_06650 [Phycisphaerae bacterium]|nr:hypothetical protein [Phycisphaerae bacterium]